MTDQQIATVRQPSQFTLYALAMAGGLGMTLMIAAALVGVVFEARLDAMATQCVGLTFVSGVLILGLAIAFWLGWVRPFERFDDINVPAEAEHH